MSIDHFERDRDGGVRSPVSCTTRMTSSRAPSRIDRAPSGRIVHKVRLPILPPDHPRLC